MLEAPPPVRASLGLIIPSSNRLTEPQMRRYAPPDVDIHVTRLRMTGAHHVPLETLLPRIAEATQALHDARCDVVVFHCTASAMDSGLSGSQLVEGTMRAAAPTAQIATTGTATVAALRALSAHSLILISPYVATTHEHEVTFLQEAGFSIAGSHHLDLPGGDAYIAVSPMAWLDLATAESAKAPTADAAFLSCTNTHTPQVIHALEAAIDRPVITSNQAVLWYALRLCHQPDTIERLGRLFHLGLAPRSPTDAQPAHVA